MEIKGHVFQINDNNRKVLFNTPHVPNMITLSLTIKELGAMLKFFERRYKGHDQTHVIKTYVSTRKVLI